ncbi:outer membrane beta-barrel protein [Helicobacter japonicus]|uniref:outer membrane beta-barrel protein n=1 Tax=Helicobacter japonicus TaxID=425400 RepID=UPI0023F13CF3|nr:outer membrane beta-barrel protein [Helicobacter japonicus]
MLIKRLILIGTLFFAGGIFAQTIEEEIQRLKEEIRFLETQNQSEELELPQPFEDTSNKKNFLAFCGGEYKNTGCFVGAELGIAPSVNNYLSIDYDFSSSKSLATPFSLIFGYQYYFTHNMGVNLKGYIGYAKYDSDMTLNDGTDSKLKSYAIHYGIDLSYLYDFISISKHTFGLNASVGYEFGSFSSSFVTPDEMGSGTTEIKLKSYNTSSFTISYGVHYFLNSSHQFWLTYKYRNYSSSNESMLQDDVIVNYGNKPIHSFNLTYAYKF